MKRNTIWFDMDGVLARFDKELYQNPDGSTISPPFYETFEGQQKFLEFQPDPLTISVFTKLMQSPSIVLGIISNLPMNPDGMKEEQIQKAIRENKMTWLHKYLKSIYKTTKSCPLLFPNENIPKAIVIENYLGRELTKSDILIDDYNKNLKFWEARGGTGIKYLNGNNSHNSFNGAKLHYTKSPDEAIKEIFTKLNV